MEEKKKAMPPACIHCKKVIGCKLIGKVDSFKCVEFERYKPDEKRR